MLVVGHTDTAGTDAVNVLLSRQRAEAVVNWLGAKGINKACLTAAGFGAQKPLADVDLVKLY